MIMKYRRLIERELVETLCDSINKKITGTSVLKIKKIMLNNNMYFKPQNRGFFIKR